MRQRCSGPLFLESGTASIRMANPFSAVSTRYTVDVAGKTYWANCAWDAFGVAAALHSDEAVIRSVCAHSGDPLQLCLDGDRVIDTGEVVHFLVPFRHW